MYRVKSLLVSGAVIEMGIWQIPKPDGERPHGYKYRLYYGRDGQPIVSYDNECGKGDHRHVHGVEEPYRLARKEVEDA